MNSIATLNKVAVGQGALRRLTISIMKVDQCDGLKLAELSAENLIAFQKLRQWMVDAALISEDEEEAANKLAGL
jgi:hypothetical protein